MQRNAMLAWVKRWFFFTLFLALLGVWATLLIGLGNGKPVSDVIGKVLLTGAFLTFATTTTVQVSRQYWDDIEQLAEDAPERIRDRLSIDVALIVPSIVVFVATCLYTLLAVVPSPSRFTLWMQAAVVALAIYHSFVNALRLHVSKLADRTAKLQVTGDSHRRTGETR